MYSKIVEAFLPKIEGKKKKQTKQFQVSYFSAHQYIKEWLKMTTMTVIGH